MVAMSRTSYNVFTSSPVIIANLSAATVSTLLTATSIKSSSGDTLLWKIYEE